MKDTIAVFRRFNRFYTKLLGLLNRHLLNGPLTLIEARALYEIGRAPGVSAVDLIGIMGMDRGQMSRILNKLIKSGLVERQGSPGGRKALPLFLTPAGEEMFAHVDSAADEQALTLLTPLTDAQRKRLRYALQEVRTLLGEGGEEGDVTVREAAPGELGWVATRHAEAYGEEYGFGPQFEEYVLLGLAEYLQNGRDSGRVWAAVRHGAPVGSVGVVLRDGGEAQLRWLLVERQARGLGVGRQLVEQALEYCRERGVRRVYLWTLQDLDAARALYESFGFTLAEEKQGEMGGQAIVEECWELVA